MADAEKPFQWKTQSAGVASVAMLAIVLGAVAGVGNPAASGRSLSAALAIVVFGAAVCAGVGRLSWLRSMGLDTAFCLIIPSLIASFSWMPRSTIASLSAAMERLDVLGWVISLLILSGCMQIDWRLIWSVAIKLGAAVLCGTIAALAMTWGVAILWGANPSRALFLQAASMMAGGLTAGALPLAAGYADQWGQSQGALLAQMLPSIFVANLSAIVGAGIANMTRHADAVQDGNSVRAVAAPMDMSDIGMAIAAIVLLHVCGALVSRSLGVSFPLVVILIAMMASALDCVPLAVVRGMKPVQNYFTSYLLFPLLWLVGMVLVPWDDVVAGSAAPLLSMAIANVLALSLVGYFVFSWTGLDPVDGATITLSRVAMGGTGVVAILRAGNRLSLLPFGLLVTRLGGALTVLVALQAAAMMHY
jgi:malate:Na+ symporter